MNIGGYTPRREASRYIYPPLFTDPEGDSCFSIYQIRWIKKALLQFFFRNFRETTRHFSLRSQNSEYPRIFQVMGANQNVQKLLSTDLVNTKEFYLEGLLHEIGLIYITNKLHHRKCFVRILFTRCKTLETHLFAKLTGSFLKFCDS